MEPNDTSLKEVTPAMSAETARKSWLYRRVAQPIIDLLKMGASPERLAWSIAVGMVIGINPLLGSTTILCLLAALIFRLNIAASQVGNHIVYPLQLALLIPFLHMGSLVFHTRPIPLSSHAMLELARSHPIELIRRLWQWEWHALIVWLVLSVILLPLTVAMLKPLLRRTLVLIQSRQRSESEKTTGPDQFAP